jgi:hypothetical protein
MVVRLQCWQQISSPNISTRTSIFRPHAWQPKVNKLLTARKIVRLESLFISLSAYFLCVNRFLAFACQAADAEFTTQRPLLPESRRPVDRSCLPPRHTLQHLPGGTRLDCPLRRPLHAQAGRFQPSAAASDSSL